MLVIICYDVSTETAAGRRRLRRVAKACEAKGQRVQKSVFECTLNQMQLENLERQLLEEIEPDEDCLRLYKISGPKHLHVKEYGKFKATDFEDTLIL